MSTPAMLPLDPQTDPKKQQFLQLLSRLGPDVFKVLGSQGQQPQVAPAPTAPPTKFDPLSTMGSLPKPIEQPISRGATPPSPAGELLASMDPKSAATFGAIQGVTSFIQNSFQRRDQKQQAEAANAAQALMSALEGAKTTGDFSPAEHILENNEALFNKVYKGWLQKAEEAKKPQKKEKPDPDVQGFEQGLATYMQGKGAAPKPPSTLTGRSGAKYFMPQAAPTQATQQQEQSRIMQEQRQDPSQPPQTPEMKLKNLQYEYEVQKGRVELQVKDAELTKAMTEQRKAIIENQTAQSRGEAIKQISQANILKLSVEHDIQLARLANTKAQLANIQARGALTAKLSSSYKVRFAAIDQAEQLLNTIKSEKRDFTPSDVRDLQQHLSTAGARQLAQSLSKTMNNHWYLPDSMTKPTAEQLLDSLEQYKQNLIVLTPAQGAGDSVDKTDDETIDDTEPIVVSPEDMK